MSDDIATIANRVLALDAAATPGPWQWYGNVRHHDCYLATVDGGRIYVMGFRRWGMDSAAPQFQWPVGGHEPLGTGVMYRVDKLPGAGPHIIAPHRGEYVGIDHPDAQVVAEYRQSAPALARAYLAMQERIERLESVSQQVQGVHIDWVWQCQKLRERVAALEAERDAAHAAGVRAERERCAAILAEQIRREKVDHLVAYREKNYELAADIEGACRMLRDLWVAITEPAALRTPDEGEGKPATDYGALKGCDTCRYTLGGRTCSTCGGKPNFGNWEPRKPARDGGEGEK